MGGLRRGRLAACLQWVKGRPLGNGPAFQDSVQLQAKVVMKTRRGVLLNDKRISATLVLLRGST